MHSTLDNNTSIAEYDLHGYDYEEYWKQNRNYEHEADRLAINKFLKNETGDWFIDIGGSYGRLVPEYRNKYLNCVLMDYSIEALKKAKKRLKGGRVSNVNLVAANVYNLPFKSNTFNAGQTIRVMHHMESPENALTEISRILKSGGIFILEFANKIHFLAKIRALVKLNPKFIFDKTPYQQPSKETKQGIKKGEGLFYNFHPKHIKQILDENNLSILRKLSVSNLRSGVFKKLFGLKLLVKIESILQKPLSLFNFGPSIYYKILKEKGAQSTSGRNIREVICCPKCKGEIKIQTNQVTCESCNIKFPITFGIYDLRWPRPSK